LRLAERAEAFVSISAVTPLRVRSDVDKLTVQPVTIPAWATAIGRDRFGLWAELTIETAAHRRWFRSIAPEKVRQRLRWIPPGRFLMGSPEDEEGRFDWEGPQHEVTIEPGFWIFDAPCTQALWQAVMGKNPSRFQGPDRPVESVSWKDCQKFVKRLNERIDGLGLGLPSEAQWEYACRAGTDTPRYGEDLDAIAWYWDDSERETHPVGGKAPNGWGLYDTLGNVWEWCADVWRYDYSERAARDSTAPAFASRVLRGGSWDSGARHVRAACRLHFDPSYRNDYLCFRCAEFREGSRA
jgi:formylglycine-generating enzyme required for sulfatase activity